MSRVLYVVAVIVVAAGLVAGCMAQAQQIQTCPPHRCIVVETVPGP